MVIDLGPSLSMAVLLKSLRLLQTKIRAATLHFVIVSMLFVYATKSIDSGNENPFYLAFNSIIYSIYLNVRDKNGYMRCG